MAATLTDLIRRMDDMAITDLEAQGLLGSIAVLAPEVLEDALDRLEKRRATA